MLAPRAFLDQDVCAYLLLSLYQSSSCSAHIIVGELERHKQENQQVLSGDNSQPSIPMCSATADSTTDQEYLAGGHHACTENAQFFSCGDSLNITVKQVFT